jgi:hypothetical protein
MNEEFRMMLSESNFNNKMINELEERNIYDIKDWESLEDVKKDDFSIKINKTLNKLSSNA